MERNKAMACRRISAAAENPRKSPNTFVAPSSSEPLPWLARPREPEPLRNAGDYREADRPLRDRNGFRLHPLGNRQLAENIQKIPIARPAASARPRSAAGASWVAVSRLGARMASGV